MLFAISILTFLIFQAIPNGDPAQRLAGRLADAAARSQDVRKQWGFDKPIYVQYVHGRWSKILTGKVISYTQQLNVLDQIKQRPAGDAVAGDRRRDHLARLRDPVRRDRRAARPGSFFDRTLTVLALIGVSTPVFLIGAVMLYYFGYKARAGSRSAATSS